MRKTQMGEAASRERREVVAVREKLHQLGVAREERGLRALRLQESLVGITGSLRAASVHIQLLKPDGDLKTMLLHNRDIRLPASVGANAPAFELARADDAGGAIGGSAPRDGRIGRAGVLGLQRERLSKRILPRREFNAPGCTRILRLPRAQRVARLLRRGERTRLRTIAHRARMWRDIDDPACARAGRHRHQSKKHIFLHAQIIP